jgi:hypothetical protein
MNLHIRRHIFPVLLAGILSVCCSGKDNEFAVRNTENITRIELSDSNNHTVLSKSETGEWLVSSFRANMQNILNLKKILTDIEVRYPLPKMYGFTYSGEKISDGGILIKIFEGKKAVKSYYLLFTDEENAEIIGLMKGKQKPYVLELPGLDVNLGDYIVAESAFWENNILFSYHPGQIKSITVENKKNPDASFSVRITDTVSLFDMDGKSYPFDRFRMDAYLSYFNDISFDSNLDITDGEKQKITSTPPLYIMTVESDTDSLTCYVNPVSDNNFDDYGNPLVYNRDFFYLTVPQKNLFAKAVWLKFDILLEELNYFRN